MQVRDLAPLAAVALLSLSAPAPRAQQETDPRVPRLFGMFDPKPGSWSEYNVVEKETGKKSRMRMAVVGAEAGAFWYEVLQEGDQVRNVIKMLVRGNPNDPENIQRLIMKSGDNPAVEMPRDFVAMGRKMAVHMFERRSGVPAAAPSDLRVETIEERKVTVPAGTFATTLQRIVDPEGRVLATYDLNPEVRPFGVVTSEADKTTMTLVGHGTDARSVITETPVPMSSPPGMPQGMPRGMPPGMRAPGPPAQ